MGITGGSEHHGHGFFAGGRWPCGCGRARITSDGKIRTCLFSIFDHDLYGVMRRGAPDEELRG